MFSLFLGCGFLRVPPFISPWFSPSLSPWGFLLPLLYALEGYFLCICYIHALYLLYILYASCMDIVLLGWGLCMSLFIPSEKKGLSPASFTESLYKLFIRCSSPHSLIKSRYLFSYYRVPTYLCLAANIIPMAHSARFAIYITSGRGQLKGGVAYGFACRVGNWDNVYGVDRA